MKINRHLLSVGLWFYIALGIASVVSSLWVIRQLDQVSSEHSLLSVTQYRQIATLATHLNTLTYKAAILEYQQDEFARSRVRFDLNKMLAIIQQTRTEYPDGVPRQLDITLSEIESIQTNVEDLISVVGAIDETDVILLNNQLSYVSAQLNDFIDRVNNDTMMELSAQSQQIVRLRTWLIILAGLIAISLIITAVFLLLQSYLNARLQEAKDIADEANQSKSRFLANMSHEIRTPLSSIVGMLNMLERTPLNAQQADYLKKCQNATRVLLGTINDILDFSKIEAEHLELEDIDYNLENIVNNLANIFAIRAYEKMLELVFRVEKDVPLNLRGDPLRVEQVLMNLIGNALKFTQTGQVEVVVRLQADGTGTDLIVIDVIDTGVGLNQDAQKTVFSGFQQADVSTTRQFGGTGLGLVISQRLARLMGGDLTVSSELNEGSTFTFEFPCRPGALVHSGFDHSDSAFLGLTAMVIDDNAASCEVMGSYLRRFGMKSIEFGSGPEALRYFDVENPMPDLVLIDWKMPGMDGLETAKRLQQVLHDSPRQPKIIFISAYGKEILLESAESMGIETVLIKPITQSTLFDSLVELFHPANIPSQPKPVQFDTAQLTIQSDAAVRPVLLVDDHELNRDTAEALIESVGFNVDTCDSGIAAVNKLVTQKTSPYSIVLMDIQMPIMDGIEATKQIRKHFDADTLPIIALTADATLDVKEKALQAGMNDFLTKPIDLKKLVEYLLQYTPAKIASQNSQNSPDTTNQIAQLKPTLAVDDALQRFNNNQAIYRKALQSFVKADDVTELSLSNNATYNAGLCHKLRGIAATIGSNDITNAAIRLENAFNQQPIGVTEKEIKAFIEQVKTLQIHISDVLAEPTDGDQFKTSAPARLNSVEQKTAQQQLSQAIAEFDPEASEHARTLLNSAEASQKAFWQSILDYLENYDFDSAQQLLANKVTHS